MIELMTQLEELRHVCESIVLNPGTNLLDEKVGAIVTYKDGTERSMYRADLDQVLTEAWNCQPLTGHDTNECAKYRCKLWVAERS